jgi:hypothetical protein
MTQTVKISCAVVLISILAGCAAVSVPTDSDPAEKLRIAQALYTQEQRPVPAENQIQEAIEIYAQQQNTLGLAEAYRQYGLFFRSESVKKAEQYFRNNGFIERSANFDTRYSKSIEYFEKARDIYTEQKKFDALTNLYLNMGFTYQLMQNREAACPVFDQMIASYGEHLKARPTEILYAPAGYANLERYMADIKKKGGC